MSLSEGSSFSSSPPNKSSSLATSLSYSLCSCPSISVKACLPSCCSADCSASNFACFASYKSAALRPYCCIICSSSRFCASRASLRSLSCLAISSASFSCSRACLRSSYSSSSCLCFSLAICSASSFYCCSFCFLIRFCRAASSYSY